MRPSLNDPPTDEQWAKRLNYAGHSDLLATEQMRLADKGYGKDKSFVMLACWYKAVKNLRRRLNDQIPDPVVTKKVLIPKEPKRRGCKPKNQR